MSTYEMTSDRVAEVFAKHAKEHIEDAIRDEIKKYAETIINDAAESIAKAIAAHVQVYRSPMNMSTNVVLVIDGAQRAVTELREGT